MKDFSKMTTAEFKHAQHIAYQAMWSPAAKFMLDASGYRFMRGLVRVDKWEIYASFKNKPRQLSMILSGIHPAYRRIMKENFDEIKCNQLELGLPPATE